MSTPPRLQQAFSRNKTVAEIYLHVDWVEGKMVSSSIAELGTWLGRWFYRDRVVMHLILKLFFKKSHK